MLYSSLLAKDWRFIVRTLDERSLSKIAHSNRAALTQGRRPVARDGFPLGRKRFLWASPLGSGDRAVGRVTRSPSVVGARAGAWKVTYFESAEDGT
jgi:hypothetical protein